MFQAGISGWQYVWVYVLLGPSCASDFRNQIAGFNACLVISILALNKTAPYVRLNHLEKNSAYV